MLTVVILLIYCSTVYKMMTMGKCYFWDLTPTFSLFLNGAISVTEMKHTIIGFTMQHRHLVLYLG